MWFFKNKKVVEEEFDVGRCTIRLITKSGREYFVTREYHLAIPESFLKNARNDFITSISGEVIDGNSIESVKVISKEPFLVKVKITEYYG